MELEEKYLDPELWHSCAGGIVQMPLVNSKVFYFPQGHAEHSESHVDFGALSTMNPMILCRVVEVKFLADSETDDVYARMRLVPVENKEHYDLREDGIENDSYTFVEKTNIETYSKTLTQSDANNGGGFSVPRQCAEMMFPPLDYTADPPFQNVTAKDLLGNTWKVRHIFRGTPRRHLLTTGWSAFVNQKKLVAGDSIVFLRPHHGDLHIGIRRAKKTGSGGNKSSSGWNTSQGSYGGLTHNLNDSSSSQSDGGRVRPESVIEAASLAARGQPFEVVYYPRLNTQAFCVKASSVTSSMRIQWSREMKFKMAFDTEDSSKITWSNGTVVAVEPVNPFHWPSSPWRNLQVRWDEPDSAQNVKRLSPWNIELIPDMPCLPPRKRLCLVQPSHIALDNQLPMPAFSNSPFGPNGDSGSSNPFSYLPDNIIAGMEGVRHAQYGFPLADLHLRNTLQLGLLATGYQQANVDVTNGVRRIGCENISCCLTVGNSGKKAEDTEKSPTPLFVLFGQPILTEQQMFHASSRDQISKPPKEENFDIEEKVVQQTHNIADRELESNQCKVFLDSFDTGRSLDLFVFSTYEELYETLCSLFEIERSNLVGKVLYYDAKGVAKHTGDEPLSAFKKTAKRLNIVTKCGNNGKRTMITICLQQDD